MKRLFSTAGCSFVFLLIAGPAHAADDTELKKAWARVGRSIREATIDAGHAVRDTAKSAGHEAKVVAEQVGGATRDAREDAGARGRNLWRDMQHGLASALDHFSDALGSLKNGAD